MARSALVTVGLHQQTVAGAYLLPVEHEHTYELTATAAATVTLDGFPGSQVAIRWSGEAGTVAGRDVTDGDTVACLLVSSGWVTFLIGGGGETPAEPVEVTVSDAVPDDGANTWTWTPTSGARMLIDGVEQTGGTYSVGDVSVTSTAAWEALPGYVLTAPSSVTFNFTGSVSAYKLEVMSDDPLYLWMLDDPAETTVLANDGSGTETLTINAGSGTTLGATGIGTGGTAIEFAPSNNTETFAAIEASAPILARLAGNMTVEVVVQHSNPGFPQAMTAFTEAGSNKFRLVSDAVSKAVTASVAAPKPADWAIAYSVVSANGLYAYDETFHLAMTWDGTTLRLYKNGTLVTDTPADYNEFMRDELVFKLGGSGAYRGQYKMAGFAIHDSALSAARLLAHAQAAGLA